jgi:hypothetical protein
MLHSFLEEDANTMDERVIEPNLFDSKIHDNYNENGLVNDVAELHLLHDSLVPSDHTFDALLKPRSLVAEPVDSQC